MPRDQFIFEHAGPRVETVRMWFWFSIRYLCTHTSGGGGGCGHAVASDSTRTTTQQQALAGANKQQQRILPEKMNRACVVLVFHTFFVWRAGTGWEGASPNHASGRGRAPLAGAANGGPRTRARRVVHDGGGGDDGRDSTAELTGRTHAHSSPSSAGESLAALE
jgi:hypothetical protein